MFEIGRPEADGWAHDAARLISNQWGVSISRTSTLRSCTTVGNHPTRNTPSGFRLHGYIETNPANRSGGIATATDWFANSRGCW